MTFDFIFIPPYLTFTVASPDHVLGLFVYLGVAIVTARLVSRVRARTDEALQESRRTAMLAELNAALIGDVTLEAILARIAERVVTVYGAAGCRMLVPGPDGALRVGASYPADHPGNRRPHRPRRWRIGRSSTASRSGGACGAGASSAAICPPDHMTTVANVRTCSICRS